MLEKTNAKKWSCHKFLKIYIPLIQLKKVMLTDIISNKVTQLLQFNFY